MTGGDALLRRSGGRRRVPQLTHAGWERLGEIGRTMRDSYDQGWGFVLETCFADFAATT